MRRIIIQVKFDKNFISSLSLSLSLHQPDPSRYHESFVRLRPSIICKDDATRVE